MPPTYAAFVPSATALPHASSSLLAATPPVVAKVLGQAYPFIVAADKMLALITWTDDDPYKSVLLVIVWSLVVNYFEVLVQYFGQIAFALVAAALLYLTRATGPQHVHPSLDTMVHKLSNLSSRFNLLVLPLTSLELTSREITRLIFTSLLMTPLYVAVTQFVLGVRQVILFVGLYLLSYHSMWARVTRAILWRWKLVRLVVFYWTGVDFSRTAAVTQSGSAGSGPLANGKTSKDLVNASSDQSSDKDGRRHVKFTYILYENQRRWLGIGWTSNMLAYERAPWTDEFLNESSAPESFNLPDSEGTGMQWRWVDKTWRVDLTNDGSLTIKSKAKLTPDPSEDQGFVYYDNMWKRPAAEYSYSKYTRRRRWVRTAELITLDDSFSATAAGTSNTGTASPAPSASNVAISKDSGSTATPHSESEPRQRRVVIDAK